MNDTDRYFTQQIVGAPWDANLGEPVNLPRYRQHGIEVDLSTGEGRVAHLAQWLLVPTPAERATRPRRTQQGAREWLHRYSLLIGLLGLLTGLGLAAWALGRHWL